jgi:predicted transposase YbfD/YdcC
VDEKTNEHKAALELLKTIVLKNCVITGDAMFCQREICQQIIDSGGDYFVVVKDNQPNLQET